MQSKKFLSVLLTLLMMAGVIAVAPVVASAAGPDAPLNLVLTPGDGEIIATWEEPPDNGDTIQYYVYDLYVSGTLVGGNAIGNVLTCTATGLTNGTEYTFGVYAVGAVYSSPLAQDTCTPHGHDFGAAWLNDATNHWHECECGEKSGLAAHIPGAAATCTAAQVCTACARQLAAATGHTPGDWVVTLEPTTTTPGSRQKKCTVCQAVTATESIAVLKAVGLFGMNTTYPSNFLNWFLFIVCFGFIWMWFI